MTAKGFRRCLWIWLGATVVICIALMATCPGCAAASNKQSLSHQQALQLEQQIEAAVAMVSTVQNEIWPIVAMVLGLGVLGLALGMFWIRWNSYLKQKPKWEKRKNGGADKAPH